MAHVLIGFLIASAGYSIIFGALPKHKGLTPGSFVVYALVSGLVPIALFTLAVLVWYLGSP